jgi:hypothetical protein
LDFIEGLEERLDFMGMTFVSEEEVEEVEGDGDIDGAHRGADIERTLMLDIDSPFVRLGRMKADQKDCACSLASLWDRSVNALGTRGISGISP